MISVTEPPHEHVARIVCKKKRQETRPGASVNVLARIKKQKKKNSYAKCAMFKKSRAVEEEAAEVAGIREGT